MTSTLASMWHQTTMEKAVEDLDTVTADLKAVHQQLLPETAGSQSAEVAPTSAPTPAVNTTFTPNKSPVDWEAELHAKDAEDTQQIKHEVEQHLTVATQVAKQRGVEPPTVEDAAADAAKRAEAEAARVATVHGNGLDPDKMPLLSKVGVPPPPEVEPPEPVMPPPPPDPIEVQAAKVESQAVHVNLLNPRLANLTKMEAPKDPIEYMKYDEEVEKVTNEVEQETSHLQKAK